MKLQTLEYLDIHDLCAYLKSKYIDGDAFMVNFAARNDAGQNSYHCLSSEEFEAACDLYEDSLLAVQNWLLETHPDRVQLTDPEHFDHSKETEKYAWDLKVKVWW